MTLELVFPTDSYTTSKRFEFCNIGLAIPAEEIKDAISEFPNCPTEVQQWVKSVVLS
jgi:hypothetical protein